MNPLEKDNRYLFKENIRNEILDAVMDIVRSSGWGALSMRKIACKIGYTAAALYEFYDSKDEILRELTRRGFLLLSKLITDAMGPAEHPKKQLETILLAYWNFALKEPELYRLMFGLCMATCRRRDDIKEIIVLEMTVRRCIKGIEPGLDLNGEVISYRFHTIWAAVHGLVAINQVHSKLSKFENDQVFQDMISLIYALWGQPNP